MIDNKQYILNFKMNYIILSAVCVLFIIKGIAQNHCIAVADLTLDNNIQKAYIKKVNYFEYDNNDYIIDSALVINDTICFESKTNEQQIHVISSDRDTPYPLIALRNNPETYYYMFCHNFYLMEDCLLLENQFKKSEYEFLKTFHLDFTRKSFDDKLFKGEDVMIYSVEKVLKKIEKRKNYFYKKLNRSKQEFSKNFISYIETEINLGAMNQFLNWYEEAYEQEIINAFLTNNYSDIHENMYNNFLNRRWNINSIQYFRTVQRVYNYQLSKDNGVFKYYHNDLYTDTNDELIKKTTL